MMKIKRWKPEEGEWYYFVCANGSIDEYRWNGDGTDDIYYQNGNCFKTQSEAQAAAEKVKALLLSLQEPVTNCSQLPKLTVEVFNRPDCPEWAKYAAVDRNGIGYFYPSKPSLHPALWVNHSTDKCAVPISGKFAASDYQNSLIERPAKLPNWCKVGEWVWSDGNYYEVIETGADWFRTSRNGDTGLWGANILYQFSQARLRWYNANEMRGLVGKVVKHNNSFYLVTGYDQDCNKACVAGKWFSVNGIMLYFSIDGKPCGVLEHLEDGEWIK